MSTVLVRQAKKAPYDAALETSRSKRPSDSASPLMTLLRVDSDTAAETPESSCAKSRAATSLSER